MELLENIEGRDTLDLSMAMMSKISKVSKAKIAFGPLMAVRSKIHSRKLRDLN